MKGARAHAAVADVSDADKILVLQTAAEQNAGHHRDHVTQMRDWPDEALLHIAKVDIEISSARRSPRLRHVLRKNLARPDAFDEHRAEIANQRRDEIPGLQRVSRADGRCFLAQ